jgi:hypothetical protein
MNELLNYRNGQQNFPTEKVQMAKKTHEKMLSLVIKEMQIKTTLRFHLTPVGIVTIKNTMNTKWW